MINVVNEKLLSLPEKEVKEAITRMYKIVLNANLRKFPDGVWKGKIAPVSMKYCTQYLVEDLLHYTPEEAVVKLTTKDVIANGLGAPLHSNCSGSVKKLLWYAYPELVQDVSVSKKHAIRLSLKENVEKLRQLFVKDGKLDRQSVLDSYGIQFLKENNIHKPNKMKLFDFLNMAFPGEFSCYEFSPRVIDWKSPNAKKLFLLDLAKQEGITKENIYQKFNYKLLLKYKCIFLMKQHTVFELANLIYPGEIDEVKWLATHKTKLNAGRVANSVHLKFKLYKVYPGLSAEELRAKQSEMLDGFVQDTITIVNSFRQPSILGSELQNLKGLIHAPKLKFHQLVKLTGVVNISKEGDSLVNWKSLKIFVQYLSTLKINEEEREVLFSIAIAYCLYQTKCAVSAFATVKKDLNAIWNA